MSMFVVTTAIGCGAVLAAILMQPPARWWIVLVIGAAYACLVALGVALPKMNFFLRAQSAGRRRPGRMRVALTFDDGPDSAATPALLDALRELRAPAAFFCIGRRVKEAPELARRIVQEGHTIGNHSLRHSWWTNFLMGKRLRTEIQSAQDAIREATGVTPRYYRSPMGLSSPHLASALAGSDATLLSGASLRSTSLLLVGWDVQPFDRGARQEKVIARILAKARDGSVILLHDGDARPDVLVRIVTEVVNRLRAAGCSFVGLDELFGADQELP